MELILLNDTSSFERVVLIMREFYWIDWEVKMRTTKICIKKQVDNYIVVPLSIRSSFSSPERSVFCLCANAATCNLVLNVSFSRILWT